LALLIYTRRVFERAPTHKRFNPKIGFAVYEKLKSMGPGVKKYYSSSEATRRHAEIYRDNVHLYCFFENCAILAPICVIDELYELYHFILRKLRDSQ
jgi:hypothetical protein